MIYMNNFNQKLTGFMGLIRFITIGSPILFYSVFVDSLLFYKNLYID